MKKKALLIMMALAVTVALAQGGGWGRGPGFKYDSSAETKLTGTIEEIKTMDSMCGTHVVVKSAEGSTEVALGPSQFLKDQSVQLNKGDKIEVIGAKATTGRGEMFIARQLIAGGKTVTLRDEKGVPAWPRGSCR